MATDPKLRSITGRLVHNKLTAREDDYTFNTQYVGTRSIDDICKLAQPKMGEKYSASEMHTLYDVLLATAKTELLGGATVEFGFTNNSVGVEGSFVGPLAQFDPEKHSVVLRSTPTAAIRKELSEVTVIVSHIEEGLPTISTITDVATGLINKQLTPRRRSQWQGHTRQGGGRAGEGGWLLLHQCRDAGGDRRGCHLAVAQRAEELLLHHPAVGARHLLSRDRLAIRWQQCGPAEGGAAQPLPLSADRGR